MSTRTFFTLRCLHRHNIFDYSLHTSIIGVTVWHLGSPNYMLYTILSQLPLCHIIVSIQQSTRCFIQPFVACPYLRNICIVFFYNCPLAKQILQLILVFYCSSCTSQLPYILSLWVQFVLVFLVLSLYLQPIYSFVLSLLNYVLVIPQ